MGGAAALRFSHLANYVLAFTPQIDVEKYEAVKRLDFDVPKRRAFKDKIVHNVALSKGFIEVHYGAQCLEDVRQVALLEGGGGEGTDAIDVKHAAGPADAHGGQISSKVVLGAGCFWGTEK
jgi:hypothetical protein